MTQSSDCSLHAALGIELKQSISVVIHLSHHVVGALLLITAAGFALSYACSLLALIALWYAELSERCAEVPALKVIGSLVYISTFLK